MTCPKCGHRENNVSVHRGLGVLLRCSYCGYTHAAQNEFNINPVAPSQPELTAMRQRMFSGKPIQEWTP